MPWTRKQVRYLESSGSPLTQGQKDKMNAELHADPSMGHKTKGSSAMKKPPYKSTMIDHHHDGSHTVTHMPHPKMSKSGAYGSMGASTSYSAAGHELMGKLKHHLSILTKPTDGEAQASQGEENEMGGEPMGEE